MSLDMDVSIAQIVIYEFAAESFVAETLDEPSIKVLALTQLPPLRNVKWHSDEILTEVEPWIVDVYLRTYVFRINLITSEKAELQIMSNSKIKPLLMTTHVIM